MVELLLGTPQPITASWAPAEDKDAGVRAVAETASMPVACDGQLSARPNLHGPAIHRQPIAVIIEARRFDIVARVDFAVGCSKRE